MDVTILYIVVKNCKINHLTIEWIRYLLVSYITVDSLLQAMFLGIKKKSVESSHVRVSLLEEWKIRYTGALRAEKSLHFGTPHKCSFCVVVARCSSDKKKKKWKPWAEKRVMTGDVIYCMGGWVDLGHRAQFIHSNKWEAINGKVFGH